MLILERPWTRQPQGAVGVDWSSSLANGVLEIAASQRFAFSRAPSAYSYGAIENNAGTGGVAWGSSTTSGGISNSGISLSGDRTVAMLVQSTAPSGTEVYFTSSSAGGAAYWIGTHAGTFAWSIGGNIAGPLYASTVNQTVFIVVTKVGTTHTIYSNGVFQNSGTNTMADGAGTTWLRYGTGTGNTPLITKAGLYFRGLWNRGMSAGEVAELNANVWKLFAPHRIPIPTAAAAASAPTITALSARLITATSAQPRISYS